MSEKINLRYNFKSTRYVYNNVCYNQELAMYRWKQSNFLSDLNAPPFKFPF